MSTLLTGGLHPSALFGWSQGRHSTAPARRPRRRGQGLVEFALVLPIFMILLGGVIQFGLIFWSAGTLSHILNDTGRWTVASQSCTPAAVQTQANQIASYANLLGYSGPASLTVTSAFDAGCPPPDNTASVYVKITMAFKVPIFFPFVPGNGNISAQGQFRIEPAPQ